MRLRISLLAALLLSGASTAAAGARTTTAPRPHVQSASLVRSGGFVYYHRTIATVAPADAAALRALSALLPRRLPAPRQPALCADCRTTRLSMVVSGRRISYVWDAAPPPPLRLLVAALTRHG